MAIPRSMPPWPAGDLLAPSWRDLAMRTVRPIFLFSLTSGVIYFFVAGRWGRWAGGPLPREAGVLQPNLFGHGHYAAYDAVLSSSGFWPIIVFSRADAPCTGRRPDPIRWIWTLAFGLIVGCALATKLTGWFLPCPSSSGRDFIGAGEPSRHCCSDCCRSRRPLRPDASLVDRTDDRPVRFFHSNLTRDQTRRIPSSVLGHDLR